MNPVVKFKKLSSTAQIPRYQTVGSSGLDLVSDSKTFILEPGQGWLVDTGLGIEIPDGFEGQVRSRSGLATQGVVVINSPGTIDSDYRGEIKVLLANNGQLPVCIRSRSRVAQLVISPVARAHIEEVFGLSETDRGEGGFGSTGR